MLFSFPELDGYLLPPQCLHWGTALLAPAPTCENWVMENVGGLES